MQFDLCRARRDRCFDGEIDPERFIRRTRSNRWPSEASRRSFAYMALDYGKEIETARHSPAFEKSYELLDREVICTSVSNAPKSYSSRGWMRCMQPGFTRRSIIPSRSAMTRSGKTCPGTSCSVVDLRCFREWPTARVRRSLLLLRAAQRSTGEDVLVSLSRSPAGNQHFSFD